MTDLKLSDFGYKMAYVVAYAEGEGLETFENIEDCVDSAVKGLEWLGFKEEDSTLQIYDDEYTPMDLDEEQNTLIDWA